MKYIAAADLHIRETTPRFRKDDYFQTGLNKLRWIIELANKENATLLVAGDIYDTSKATSRVVNRIMEIIVQAKYPPIVVEGQHDLLYHKDLVDSPLYTLGLSKYLTIHQQTEEICTVPWTAEIPDVKSSILMMHKCITEDTPPFFLPDAVSAGSVLRKHGQNHSYIVSGDYHVPFVVKYRKCNLINCGTMLRNTKDMIDYKPCVFMFDSDIPLKVKRIEIPIAPPEEVFDLDAIAYQEKHGIQMDLTKMAKLIEQGFEEVEFSPIVWRVYEESGSTVDKNLIWRILRNA